MGSRAERDGGGSDPTATLTHGASKGGVAPASSGVWAASFLVALLDVISFPLFFSSDSLHRSGEASREVLGSGQVKFSSPGSPQLTQRYKTACLLYPA